jgi:hypothetical protein
MKIHAHSPATGVRADSEGMLVPLGMGHKRTKYSGNQTLLPLSQSLRTPAVASTNAAQLV